MGLIFVVMEGYREIGCNGAFISYSHAKDKPIADDLKRDGELAAEREG